MKYIKLFESIDKVERNAIEGKLIDFGISNYTINEDGTVDVDGNVDLLSKGLTKIPFKFGRVSGFFSCSYNRLIDLKGTPHFVGNDFNCFGNNLSTLNYGPEIVEGNYRCNKNCLVSLEGAPAEVGKNFNCDDNNLILLNCTTNVRGNIYCRSNKINPNKPEFYGYVGGKIIYNKEDVY